MRLSGTSWTDVFVGASVPARLWETMAEGLGYLHVLHNGLCPWLSQPSGLLEASQEACHGLNGPRLLRREVRLAWSLVIEEMCQNVVETGHLGEWGGGCEMHGPESAGVPRIATLSLEGNYMPEGVCTR